MQRQVLADLLQNAARAAREREHHGLVLLLDELREPSEEELVVLANAIQDAGKASEIPLAIFAARRCTGTPTLSSWLCTRRAARPT